MVKEVEIASGAQKQLKKLPGHVVTKFLAWVKAVQDKGLEEVRKSPGFHDEPVKGIPGQRSIRLSQAYRRTTDSRRDRKARPRLNSSTSKRWTSTCTASENL